MNGLQLSGLVSGFDWRSVVDQLIQLERVPQNQLRSEQSANDRRSDALSDLEDELDSLKEAVENLNDTDLFANRSVTLQDEDSFVLTAKADAGTVKGTFDFDITQLATESSIAGSTNVGSAIAPTADVSGVTLSSMNLASAITAGTFSVNGQEVTVATTDSLQDVFDAINTATGGAVTASYNAGTDEIELTSGSEIVLGNPNDTSNFLTAAKLFSNGTGSVSSSSSIGVLNQSASLSSSGLATAITNVDGSGNGTFTINGVDIDFNVNDDSVNDIINRVNDSDAGVLLNYDSVADSFELTNKETGSLGVSISETAGGLLEAFGLNSGGTLALGANAQYTVNGGGTIISTSNELTADTHGIAGLTVTAEDIGSETLTIEADNSNVREKIDAFVEAYNSVQSFVEDKTRIEVSDDDEVTTALLSDNREVSGLGRELRTRVFGTVPSLTGVVKRIQDLGIDFKTGSNELEIEDETKLEEALTQNATAVTTLFTDETDGLAKALEDFIENFTGDGGTLQTQKNTLTEQNKKIDLQIDALERQILAHEEQMVNSFVQMERAQAEINQQMAALSRNFG